MSIADEAVIVEFQATRPDGCVSLELNATKADIRAKQLLLVDGQPLRVWEPWGNEEHVAEGVVRWSDEWGWGVQIDPEALLGLLP
jgi:hypothetical protein